MGKMGKAVWSHPTRDFTEGIQSVSKMVERLKGAGFDLIIPCVKGTDGALSYHSRIGEVHPGFRDWDPLEALSQEASKAGLKVHPWMCVFTEGDRSRLLRENPDLVARDREGNPLGWACPRREEVQRYELSLYEEVMERYDVAGLHLDYIRHAGPQMCFCQVCRDDFRKLTGKELTKLTSKDEEWERFLEWRAEPITRFVRNIREMTRRRDKELSAAVFPEYPSCLIGVGQDWVRWVEERLVDYLFPMNYTNSSKVAVSRTRCHIALVGESVPVWEGLGKSSSASYLPTEKLMRQIEGVLDAGAQGIVLFHYAAVEDSDLDQIGRL